MIEQRLEKFGTEKIFVAVFLIFGAINCFVRPPYQLMDEAVHFARVWQISEGIFISPLKVYDGEENFGWKNYSPDAAREKLYAASLPSSLVPDEFIFHVKDDTTNFKFSFAALRDFLATPLNVDEREAGLIPNTGIYPPPAYFPQAVTAYLGRNLNLTAGAIYYLMNLSGLIFVAVCLFWAMKFLPQAKPLIFLLAMMPTFLIEAASTSIDAVTYGVSFLGTAWLLSLKNSTEKFSRAEIFGLIILSLMLCVKSVYATILLLFFLIPPARAGSLKKFLALGATILLLNLFVSLMWTKLALGAGEVVLATSRQYLGVENVDVAAQKFFIIEHPQIFFAAMINALREYGLNFCLGFIGTWGATAKVHSAAEFYLLYWIILLSFALTSGLRFKIGERVVMLFAAALSTLAFFIFEYLTWMPVGATIIRGVQGRYFIPLALMIFGSLSILPPLRHKNSIALAAGVFSGAMTLQTNLSAFY